MTLDRFFALSSLALLTCAVGAAPARGEETGFRVTASAVPSKVGAAATAHVAVKAASGYHVNKDFPTSLKLTPTPGVDLPKATLNGHDAGVKVSEAALDIDVPYTAREAGKRTVEGTLSFAVCTATTCDPRKVKVSLTIEAR